MHTVADYLFVASVMLPSVALAVGFLILVSPRAIARTEQSHAAPLKAH